MKTLLATTTALILTGAAAYADDTKATDLGVDEQVIAENQVQTEEQRGYGGASTMTGGTDNGQSLDDDATAEVKEGERGFGGASTMTAGNPNVDDVDNDGARGDTQHPEG